MIFCESGFISKARHKAWELEITNEFGPGPFFDFQFGWTRRCDHAGLIFRVEVLSFYLCFRIYDTRHWNYETNDWEKYPKQDEND